MSSPSRTSFVEVTTLVRPSSHSYSRRHSTPSFVARTATRAATFSPVRGTTGVPTSAPSRAKNFPSALAFTASNAPP
jgi:hypothetical protein